jgi:hypothetical protein
MSMNSTSTLNSNLRLQSTNRNFVLPETPMPPSAPTTPLCPDAQKLKEFANKECAEVLQDPSHILLNQTRLKVLHRFLELYCSAPKHHRGISKSHICLVTTLIDTMLTLRECELTIAPPQLYIPPPPVPPSQPQIMGVFMGELDS